MKSLGNGSGFSNIYTSAYFIDNNDLILIDIGDSAYHRLQKMDLVKYENIYIFITHTHFDHVGALPIFVQYLFYNYGKIPTIVAPCKVVKSDLKKLLEIGDIANNMYNLKNAETLKKSFLVCPVKTTHSPLYLNGRCFGYVFCDNGKHTVYTGDTCTLEPFKEYITADSYLYVDTSVHYGQVHLKLEYMLDELKLYAASGVKIYLMHLDDIATAKEIIKGIKNIYIF